MTSARLPLLYSFRRCPYAMRARMALAVSGVKCELREVLLRDKPAAMLEASQKGTVPVLVLPDGDVIDESIDVMNWALKQNDSEGWLDAESDEKNALIEENDGPFKHHLDRYKYSTRYEDEDTIAHREQGEKFLRRLDHALDGADFLFLDKRSFADIAIFPFVRQFRIADPNWFDTAHFKNVQAWLQRCVSMPLFKTVMQKYEPWAPGDPTTIFPPCE